MAILKSQFEAAIDAGDVLDGNTSGATNTYSATGNALFDAAAVSKNTAEVGRPVVINLDVASVGYTAGTDYWDLIAQFSDDNFTTVLNSVTRRIDGTSGRLSLVVAPMGAKVRLRYVKTGAPANLVVNKGWLSPYNP